MCDGKVLRWLVCDRKVLRWLVCDGGRYLSAVEGPDDEIDDTQMEGLLVRISALLLPLDPPHQLLSLLILPRGGWRHGCEEA